MTQIDFVPWITESPGAQAINRAASILRVLAIRGAAGASVGEIAEATGLATSTVHRLLSALVDERLAERARGSRRYRLGMEIVALGAAAGAKHDLRALARPSLERVAVRYGHRVHLVIRAGHDVVCLDQVVPDGSAPTIGVVGSRAPLGVTASGVALLAFMNADEISEAMAHSKARLSGHPTFSVERTLEEVGAARRSGYGVSSVEHNPRVYGVAVPVLSDARRPLAALGITTASGTPLAQSELHPVVETLQHEAALVAAGYEQLHSAAQEVWRGAGAREDRPERES